MNSRLKKNANGVNGSSVNNDRGVAPGRGGWSQGPPRSSSSEILRRKRLRFGTLNVGSMTGKSREVAAMLSERRVDVCCVQETRWKGNSAKMLGDGYKLFYSGESSGRNGVGIVLKEDWWEGVVGVRRVSSRVMVVEMVVVGERLNVVSVYAPQVGSDKEEKGKFWEEFDETLNVFCRGVKLVVGGDLNGHVGREAEGFNLVHGGWGYGKRNAEGEAVLEAAVAHDLVLCNTLFVKEEKHLVTYEASQGKSQIDFLCVRKEDKGKCRDCKVVCSAWEGQHKLVVMVFEWMGRKVGQQKIAVEKVKWGKLKEKKGELSNKLDKEIDWSAEGSVQEMWDRVAPKVRECCRGVLGVTKAGVNRVDKETWWWGDEVQNVVRAKKQAFQKWRVCKNNETLNKYKEAKKEARKAVAVAKARKYDQLYERLEEREGEKEVYRVAKQRERNKSDVGRVKCVKDEEGRVLVEEERIRKRWESYFCSLLNEGAEKVKEEQKEENVEEVVEDVTLSEVERAVKKMKNGKAVGPDSIPVEVWKFTGSKALEWLRCMFNKLLRGDRIPEEWRGSWLVPLYKGKGDVQECKNYRGIKLLSHTMKLWERVLEARLRKVTQIEGGQFGFMPGRSTTEPIFMLRQLMEKKRKGRKKLQIVFVDLEKAYDKVPRKLVWEVLNRRAVASEYVNSIKDMYRGAKTSVRSESGMSDSFEVRIGVHQGSALSPYLFILVMDEVLKGVIKEAPWCMLFADDIVIIGETVEEVSEMVERIRAALEQKGLRVNKDKTEHMESVWKGEADSGERVSMQGVQLKKVTEYKYLGSLMQQNGEIENEVNSRIQVGWAKWKAASGVLCDKRVPMRVKGKFYSTVVRPAMIYGGECWAMKKVQQQKVHVAEMRMLRFMSGVTRKDRIENEYVRENLGVDCVGDVMAQSRLRWYGHVMRKLEEDVVKRVWKEDTGSERRRGRPELTWDAVVKRDMEERGLKEYMVWDKEDWRLSIRIPTLARLGKQGR